MMHVGTKAILALGLCFAASQSVAQPGPPQPAPPPPQPVQPQPAQPQPGQDNGPPPPRNQDAEAQKGEQRMSWYNGDYVAESISRVTTIDDPVTGFGNEALWVRPASHSVSAQSDIAGSAEPD